MQDTLIQILQAKATHDFLIMASCLFLFGYSILIYNNLVRLKQNIDKAWSNIDVLLKQRLDELTKLISICKEYMQYEQNTLEEITLSREQCQQARSANNQKAVGHAEHRVRRATKELFALAEAYPQLKTHKTFNELEKRLSELEDMIADRRVFFNETVTQYNIRIRSIPDILLASLLGYHSCQLMVFPEEETADIDIAQQYRG